MWIQRLAWAIGRLFCEFDDKVLYAEIKATRSEILVLRTMAQEQHRLIEIQSIAIQDGQIHQAECVAAYKALQARQDFLTEEWKEIIRSHLERTDNQSPSGGRAHLKMVDDGG